MLNWGILCLAEAEGKLCPLMDAPPGYSRSGDSSCQRNAAPQQQDYESHTAASPTRKKPLFDLVAATMLSTNHLNTASQLNRLCLLFVIPGCFRSSHEISINKLGMIKEILTAH